jgi:hypothetical protein
MFKNEEITSHVKRTMYLLQENDLLVKKYSDDHFEKIDRLNKYFESISAIECYIDRLNKKRTAFRECWVEKIKQAENQSIEVHTTSLDVCDVFSMAIQIQQSVFISNEVDLEINEPSFHVMWENLEGYLWDKNLLCEKDKEHLKQLLQDLGYFFITKGDDTHVAIIKAHIMKQLNK